ncbi:MAG: 30S ribosomal protein S9 [Chlamydiota bacterium]|jgi:small subunit ribosomal protein S9
MAEDILGTGRRKTAVSSVRLRRGKGAIKVNGRDFKDYFFSEFQRKSILAPLEMASMKDKFDIIINAKGGGLDAQAEATRLGLSRALVKENEDLHKNFKELGLLTRDSRKKERKKYGLAGARKKFQFSKR